MRGSMFGADSVDYNRTCSCDVYLELKTKLNSGAEMGVLHLSGSLEFISCEINHEIIKMGTPLSI